MQVTMLGTGVAMWQCARLHSGGTRWPHKLASKLEPLKEWKDQTTTCIWDIKQDKCYDGHQDSAGYRNSLYRILWGNNGGRGQFCCRGGVPSQKSSWKRWCLKVNGFLIHTKKTMGEEHFPFLVCSGRMANKSWACREWNPILEDLSHHIQQVDRVLYFVGDRYLGIQAVNIIFIECLLGSRHCCSL